MITDTHVPYLDGKSWKALKNYIEWRQGRQSRVPKIDKVVHLGDLAEWESINPHSKHTPRLVEGKRLADDFYYANKFLDEVQNLVPDVTLIEGNHEYWVQRFIDDHPNVEGLIDIKSGLKIETRGIRYHEYWKDKAKVYKIGKAFFGHGYSTAKNHAKVHVEDYGHNFFYGHVHANQRFAKSRVGKQKHYLAESIHCMCEVDRDWLLGKPTAWTNGFATFTFDKSGYFWHNVVQIQGGRFVAPEGDMFTTKGRIAC